MAALATFVRFWFGASAGSSPPSTVEATQFTEARSVTGTAPLGYYSTHIFEMQDYTGSFTPKERGQWGIHWINTTAGEIDTTWTSADFAAVETAMENLFSGQVSLISNDVRLVEHRWYAYGPGITKPNPASRITTIATPIVGTTTAGDPHQVANTVTLRTALRKHWGRFYLPIAGSKFDNWGQLSSANVDSIASTARAQLLAPGTAQGVVPVVWDRARHIGYGVTQIEVDSVPDIIRRRRPRTTGYKKIYSA